MKRRDLLTGALALAFTPNVLGQGTQRPVRIIVPFPAGGSTDVLARLIADKMRSNNYAPSVIVENRVGASGRTGVEAVKNAEPDGTTLLFTPDFLMTVYPHSFKKLSYEPLKDFVPVAVVASSGLALAAGPALPAQIKTVKDYLAWAKANPKQASYATTAAGGTPHFVGVMLAQAAGVELTAVHYKGGGPSLQDLIGGQIPVSVNPIGELLPQLKGGKIRILAITSARRSRFLPDVPTMAEAGFPSIQLSPWLGFFAPARTPADVVKRVSNAINDAVQSGDTQQNLFKFGMESAAATPIGFGEIVRQDLEKWRPIVKASGFSAED